MKEPNQIEFYLDSPEELEAVLFNNKHKLTVTIAEFLVWALENNVDSFVFADILFKDPISKKEENFIKLGCERKDYYKALQKQINNLIEFEEYEMCPKLQEWIDYLKIEEKVKNEL